MSATHPATQPLRDATSFRSSTARDVVVHASSATPRRSFAQADGISSRHRRDDVDGRLHPLLAEAIDLRYRHTREGCIDEMMSQYVALRRTATLHLRFSVVESREASIRSELAEVYALFCERVRSTLLAVRRQVMLSASALLRAAVSDVTTPRGVGGGGGSSRSLTDAMQGGHEGREEAHTAADVENAVPTAPHVDAPLISTPRRVDPTSHPSHGFSPMTAVVAAGRQKVSPNVTSDAPHPSKHYWPSVEPLMQYLLHSSDDAARWGELASAPPFVAGPSQPLPAPASDRRPAAVVGSPSRPPPPRE